MFQWALRSAVVFLGLGAAALTSAGAEQTVQRQDGTVHKVTAPFIMAEGRESATPALPGCKFLGVWRGGYFSSGGASIWLDAHDGWRDWVAEYTGPEGFDGEIILVQRATLNTTTIPFGGDSHRRMSHIRTPPEEDLVSGFDVYLCLRPRTPPPPPPLVIIQSLDPLTIQLIPQSGTAFSGDLLLVSPPGVSELGGFTVPVAVDTAISGPTVFDTGAIVPVVPLVDLGLEAGTNPAPGQHGVLPRAVAPVPNDRTAFVFQVTPNSTMWRPIFRLIIAGAPAPFDFPGPRVFNAFDPQIITLNLPNTLVPSGTDLNDIQLQIGGNLPLNQAPPEARVFNRGPIFSLTDGNPGEALFQTTLFNPLDAAVTFSNDSVGLVLTNCSTGEPLFSLRSPLNQTIPAGGHLVIDYDPATRVDLGGGAQIPPFPDPLSPTFEGDLFDWFDDICMVAESRPALTLP